MSNKFGAGLMGVCAGFNGGAALNCILQYVNAKAAIVQSELAKAPELTDQVYQAAMKTAESMASTSSLTIGITCAAVAGGSAALAAFYATRNE